MKYSLRFSIRNFFLREISFLGRQRFMTLLFYEAVLTVGLNLKLFGLTGITEPWFFTINALFLGVVLILFLLYIAYHTAQGLFICHHHCFARIPVVGNNHLHKRRLGCHRPSCACQHSFAFAQRSLLHNVLSEMEFLPIGIPYRCHVRHFHVSDSQFLTARISAADYYFFCHVVFLQRKACGKLRPLEQRKRQIQTRRARASFPVQNET